MTDSLGSFFLKWIWQWRSSFNSSSVIFMLFLYDVVRKKVLLFNVAVTCWVQTRRIKYISCRNSKNVPWKWLIYSLGGFVFCFLFFCGLCVVLAQETDSHLLGQTCMWLITQSWHPPCLGLCHIKYSAVVLVLSYWGRGQKGFCVRVRG